MFETIASLWHTLVFLWAIATTIVICYDHADKIRELVEWLVDLFRGVR